MPFESPKQRRAMFAAASGNSTIGIRQHVARAFIRHAKRKKRHKSKHK